MKRYIMDFILACFLIMLLAFVFNPRAHAEICVPPACSSECSSECAWERWANNTQYQQYEMLEMQRELTERRMRLQMMNGAPTIRR